MFLRRSRNDHARSATQGRMRQLFVLGLQQRGEAERDFGHYLQGLV
jgi:hypothetical protein